MIRAMERRDLPEAARLAAQLGYPTSESEVAARFDRLARSADECVYVAEVPGRGVAGWIHLPVLHARERGIGRALIDEAERWARMRGVGAIRLQSTQHAFEKRL